MTHEEELQLKKVCTPQEFKFIKDLECFLRTHKHGRIYLFGHSGKLYLEKHEDSFDGSIRLKGIDSILCDGGDPDRAYDGLPNYGEYIELDDYIEYLERDAN